MITDSDIARLIGKIELAANCAAEAAWEAGVLATDDDLASPQRVRLDSIDALTHAAGFKLGKALRTARGLEGQR